MISRLALTPGEPAGIGPDLCVMLAQHPHPKTEIVVVADPFLLQQRAERLDLALELLPFDNKQPATPLPPGQVRFLPVALENEVACGQLNPANAGYVLETLKIATEGCINGNFDGMITGPAHKGVINDAGLPFTGHTEYLSTLCDNAHPVMMLAIPDLRVALVTTHLPLAEVSQAITKQRLRQVASTLHQDLQQRFGIQQPRIMVCGLNPHAGEQGYLGREEIDIIQPVLAELNSTGMQLIGPLPADTLFTPIHLQQADAVLAMYHDQGLPVLKHLGFGNAVNITLGLPIVRTSVDHGTALPLAGTNQIDLGSLKYAVKVAETMARSRHRASPD
ncbi:MAG: 4-hydroxythreonine-4-phosphate dehydrogenase PdxA [Candidatus Thiodiazotropha sp. (ex Lucinoma aequizonata)]|nr:4-hydroxythreonine-4-phosphate dehydrogenase PdxA [Candidatus Thiodiazotropha sp. (ex Lucinoma aequizonata)]MCU7887954.1 4-hydroxythreonine-4-phosphate dehydrogenase PdxA [Candidatus Thiodiazotropha sp. (ex Lucinoma aequizonata)]MCU7894579.1 4-hydroxythreonine-4-phosphate dehydrogenase PdxA [Candidatus Thiodiazotropha sp. (ex Lucinoma aequizonata)]MCU7899832.1 4-hydroxythreonine-4-phosphate dehydrogenase PdxA [Candidatus Thiodiazotropha sp. (ex Lucinoma aequizonata)]MCU7901161.1 4-hydroxythr